MGTFVVQILILAIGLSFVPVRAVSLLARPLAVVDSELDVSKGRLVGHFTLGLLVASDTTVPHLPSLVVLL